MRMGRYLSGPGDEPVEALVPHYLAALEDLSNLLDGLSSSAASRVHPLPHCCIAAILYHEMHSQA